MVSWRAVDAPNLSALPQNPRILVIRLSAMGDLVFALPAVKALKDARPDAKIEWLVEDKHAALLNSCPFIDKVLLFPRSSLGKLMLPLRLAKHLAQLKKYGAYDLVIDFQSNLKSALQLTAIKSKCKMGFAAPIAKEGAQRFHHVNVHAEKRMPRAIRDGELLRAILPNAVIPDYVHWPIDAEIVNGYSSSDLTLLHTTTTQYGRDKDWGADKWTSLAQQLKSEGHKVALLHTPADAEYVNDIAVAAGVDLAPATPSIEYLLALLDTARLLISTDSGPAHIASLRGTKVVCLFGATDPLIYSPPGDRHKLEIVYANALNIAPPKRQRDRQSPLMQAITVAEVLAASESLLKV
ncbi:MAG: ADP-heptose:LPS heptosyltransferase [Myxococcota bacterium]|jgi:ADP-heptose:LPS heptosyltransferase